MSQVPEESFTQAQYRNTFKKRFEFLAITVLGSDANGTHFQWDDARGERHFGVISDLTGRQFHPWGLFSLSGTAIDDVTEGAGVETEDTACSFIFNAGDVGGSGKSIRNAETVVLVIFTFEALVSAAGTELSVDLRRSDFGTFLGEGPHRIASLTRGSFAVMGLTSVVPADGAVTFSPFFFRSAGVGTVTLGRRSHGAYASTSPVD